MAETARDSAGNEYPAWKTWYAPSLGVTEFWGCTPEEWAGLLDFEREIELRPGGLLGASAGSALEIAAAGRVQPSGPGAVSAVHCPDEAPNAPRSHSRKG